mmetsp:Transcript_89782/g.159629  ORF Transcript_89782/g.159629 Transcript_89782/m.159629 type:complete len:921 (+) Transcript_89782:81-2843(+)
MAAPKSRQRSQSGLNEGSADRIQVAVRARPLNSKELQLGNKSIFNTKSDGTIEELDDDGKKPNGKKYLYDNAFNPELSNKDVYETQCKSIIMGALDGYNGTIFAYGQTGSGKTHTVMGDPQTNPGITILAIDEIFKWVAASPNMKWEVQVSYVEIYNESITDLLQADINLATNLKIIDDPKYGPIVQNVTDVSVTSLQDCLDLFADGEKRRSFAATDMNAKSSRSHTLFRLRIEGNSEGGGEAGAEVAAQNMRKVANEFMATQKQLTADRASLYLIDNENDELYIQAGEITLKLPKAQGIAGACATNKQVINIPDAYQDERFNREVDQRTGYRTQTILCTPIKSLSGDIIGVSQFINKKGSSFDSGDEAQVAALNARIAPLILGAEANAAQSISSRLNLVDLAGSERQSKTNAKGANLKEAGFINKSLMMLGTCISLLSEGKEGQHIPFRDSKLTRLLSTSLGGNTRTCLLCAFSPASRNREETRSTLQFATRAKKIKNKPTQNKHVDPTELCAAYQKEIERLKETLRRQSSSSQDPIQMAEGGRPAGPPPLSAELQEKLTALRHRVQDAQELVDDCGDDVHLQAVAQADLEEVEGSDVPDMAVAATAKNGGLSKTEWLTAADFDTRLETMMRLQQENREPRPESLWAFAKLEIMEAEVDAIRQAAGLPKKVETVYVSAMDQDKPQILSRGYEEDSMNSSPRGQTGGMPGERKLKHHGNPFHYESPLSSPRSEQYPKGPLDRQELGMEDFVGDRLSMGSRVSLPKRMDRLKDLYQGTLAGVPPTASPRSSGAHLGGRAWGSLQMPSPIATPPVRAAYPNGFSPMRGMHVRTPSPMAAQPPTTSMGYVPTQSVYSSMTNLMHSHPAPIVHTSPMQMPPLFVQQGPGGPGAVHDVITPPLPTMPLSGRLFHVPQEYVFGSCR